MATRQYADPPPCRKLNHAIHGGPPAIAFVAEDDDGDEWAPACGECLTKLVNVAAFLGAELHIFRLAIARSNPYPAGANRVR
jgi:hypothetical protein